MTIQFQKLSVDSKRPCDSATDEVGDCEEGEGSSDWGRLASETEKSTVERTVVDRAVDPSIVFRTRASYHPFLLFLLVFVIIATVLSVVLAFLDRASVLSGVYLLLFKLSLLLPVYTMVLPLAFEVRSDSCIAVKTTFCTYRFPGAVRAYRLNMCSSDVFRPRFKLTSLSNQISVRRESGWDLLVSPQDADEFIEAIEQIQSTSHL